MEPDDQHESNDVMSWRAGFIFSAVCPALSRRRNKGCNAVERPVSTGQCGRDVAPLPGAQQNTAAVKQGGHTTGDMCCPSHVGLPTPGEVGVCGKQKAGGGSDA